MSSKQLRNDSGKDSPEDKRSLEDFLQSIVNVSSQIMELADVPLAEFSEIEAKFEEASTFEEVLVIIEHMAILSLGRLKKAGAGGRSERKRSHKEERATAEANSNSTLGNSSYEELEKLLQKYEAEIREHIKIEQQMKIYSDNLEERVAELEAAFDTEVSKAKNFEREVQRLKSELEGLQVEKQPIKTKIQLANGKSLGISVPKHRKTQSIDAMGSHHHTQMDLIPALPLESKVETKKHNQSALRTAGSQKMKRAFNFNGKGVLSNLKNFYGDFLNTQNKAAQKTSCNSRSENESVRLPLKTLEKIKDGSRQNMRK